MSLWLIAIVLLAGAGTVGYYQGAIRGGFTFVGLLAATFLAKPLSGTMRWVPPLVGASHPVLVALIAPGLVFVLLVLLFKVVGQATYKKVDAQVRGGSSDMVRSLYNRLSERWGLCLGLLNGAAYFYILCVVIAVIGYATTQLATGEKDSFALKTMNSLQADLQSTGMAKAVAPFNPATEQYLDGADIVGDIFQNPLVQKRLSAYPVFLPLTEKPEFKEFGGDIKFQEAWATGMALPEFLGHERVKALVNNHEIYTNVVASLGGDLKDLKTYLETDVSPKYDDVKILGHWDYEYSESMARALKAKGRVGSAEIRKLKLVLAGIWGKAKFSAYLDSQAELRMVSTNKGGINYRGTWKGEGTKYSLELKEGNRKLAVEATVEGNRLLVNRDELVLVFAK